MKKVNVVLIAIIILLVIAICTISIILYNVTKKDDENNILYYGQRGNITDASRIEFLSKNEDFLVGMIGVEYNENDTEFSENDMINFALYVAKFRYENLLKTQTNSGKIVYRIDTEIIDDIIEEFFGERNITYSTSNNDYYSSYSGTFFFGENFQKSMWVYPIDEEIKEESIEKDEEKEDAEESADYKEKYTIITADSIYLNETEDPTILKERKYDGKYNEEDVEYTIKLKFDEKGKLVSYQYLKIK